MMHAHAFVHRIALIKRTAKWLMAGCLILPTWCWGAHAFTLIDTPKYPPDATHFDYVNPEAPKKGTLRLHAMYGYTHFNPFIITGQAADGSELTLDTLMAQSLDEPETFYPLIADDINVTKHHVRFHINPKARFHDHQPITAEDVLYTFDLLRNHAKVYPYYKLIFKDITDVQIIDDQTIEFTYDEEKNREIPALLAGVPVLAKHDDWNFEKSPTPPLGSGPYRVGKDDYKTNQYIHFKRVKDYWAQDLLSRKGLFNFDVITMDYYLDTHSALSAFLRNQYDYRIENVAKNWKKGYPLEPQCSKTANDCPHKFHMKRLPNKMPPGLQAFLYNIRRPQFHDARVREAIAKIYNFEWANQKLFFNEYQRANSYFSNSALSHVDPLRKDSLEYQLLNKHRDDLPPEVFTKPFKVSINDTASQMRQNLNDSTKLLNGAGYWVDEEDGILYGPNHQPYTFEILLVSPSFERVVVPFVEDLKRLGIFATYRIVDSGQYINRLNSRDFDMIVGNFNGNLYYPGNEQRAYWHSDTAERHSSQNLIGVKNPVIDDLVSGLIDADDYPTAVAYTHALDRVLLWNHYMIPQWYLGATRIAYWDRIDMPKRHPIYGFTYYNTWEKRPVERK